MDKDDLYLFFPAVALGLFIFISVILSLIIAIPLFWLLTLSSIITIFIIGGTYLYRKKNDLLSDEEKNLEDTIVETFKTIYHYFDEKYSLLLVKFNLEPRNSDNKSYTSTHNDNDVEWIVDFIENIEPNKFKDLCGYFLKLNGIQAEQTTSRADGVDFKIYKPSQSSTKPIAIAQCEIKNGSKIEANDMRKLIGTMDAIGVQTSFFFTNSQFTVDAIHFASKNRDIRLFDSEKLLEKIQSLPEQKKQLLYAKIIAL